jgi:small subunit ribosomal protein S8
MKHDELADLFNILKYTESIGRTACTVPASRLIRGVLEAIKKREYIAGYEPVTERSAARFRVTLAGKINDCNVIRPRFSVPRAAFIKWEKKFLPADNIGILLLTTPQGVMDQREAKARGIGGKLLGYVY